MTTPTEQRSVTDAREFIRLARQELEKCEDIFAHAASFRGSAFLDSLRQTYEYASSARIHALQLAIAKVRA
jgi:hypothetical protein